MYTVKLRNWIIGFLAAVLVLGLTAAGVLCFMSTGTESALADTIEISSKDDFTEETYGEGENAVTYYTLSNGDYKLAEDIELDKYIEIESGTEVTLDLNGHNLIGTGITNSDFAFIIVNGNLAIGDSTDTWDNYYSVDGGNNSEEDTDEDEAEDSKDITYVCNVGYVECSGANTIGVNETGTLTVNGGLYVGESGSSTIYLEAGSHATINYAYIYAQGSGTSDITTYGTLYINGGYINDPSEDAVLVSGGDMYIYGGTITSGVQAIYISNDSIYDDNITTLDYTTVTIGTEGISDDAISISSNDVTVILMNGCTLNIYSGTICTTGVSSPAIDVMYDGSDASANLNIYGGIITGTEYGISVEAITEHGVDAISYVNVSISGGTISATGEENYGLYLEGSGTYAISGGEITGSVYGVYLADSDEAQSQTVLAISGGTISATDDDGIGLYLNGTGTYNIAGGEISGGIGVKIEDGTVNILDGTIYTTSEKIDSTAGAVSHGVALYLLNGSASDMTVTISGGVFTGTYNCVAYLAGNSATAGSESTLTISGGVFSSGETDTDYCIEEYGSSYITVSIEGGEFHGYITDMNDMTITGGSFTLLGEIEIFDMNALDLSNGLVASVETKYVTMEPGNEDECEAVLYTVTISQCTNLVNLAEVNSKYAADTTSVTYTSNEYTFGSALYGDGYTVTVAEGTNVGEYTVTVTCEDGAYFQLEDGTVLSDKTVIFTYTITKAITNSVTLTEEDGTYTATADFGKAVLKYYTDEECTEEITGSITASGTYYVRAEVDGTDNYAGAVSDTLSFTISITPSYSISLPTQEQASYAYGDEAIPESFGEEFVTEGEMHYTVTLVSGTDAGTYTVYVVADEYACFLDGDGSIVVDENGNAVMYKAFMYTISQASNSVEFSIAEDGTYISSSAYGEVTYKYYSDEECTQEITAAITTSGTYYVRAEVESTDNYAGAVSDPIAFTVTIPTGDGISTTDILAIVAIVIILLGLAISLAIIFGHRRVKYEVVQAEATATAPKASPTSAKSAAPAASAKTATSSTAKATEPAAPVAAQPPAPKAAEPAGKIAHAAVQPVASTAANTTAAAAAPGPVPAAAAATTPAAQVKTADGTVAQGTNFVTIPAKPRE
ncbi:MAG: hypothetical protein LUD50_02055 [Clostridia bacterium]|nr:hypothetical protein [Clostridia bacterium]